MRALDALHIDAPDNHHRPWVLCATCRMYQRAIWEEFDAAHKQAAKEAERE